MELFVQAVQSCIGKYVTFSGRASRSEFWYFYLFYVLVLIGAYIVGRFSPLVLLLIANFVLLLPFYAAGCRRLHDTGRSGWWILLLFAGPGVIVLIVWWIQEPKEEGSKYEIQGNE